MGTEEPQLDYAGFGVRLVAQLLDLIVFLPLTVAAFVASRYSRGQSRHRIVRSV
jgi:hypothetical protein